MINSEYYATYNISKFDTNNHKYEFITYITAILKHISITIKYKF